LAQFWTDIKISTKTRGFAAKLAKREVFKLEAGVKILLFAKLQVR